MYCARVRAADACGVASWVGQLLAAVVTAAAAAAVPLAMTESHLLVVLLQTPIEL
jgi:hypothetical protein